jgi:hypothetical protein
MTSLKKQDFQRNWAFGNIYLMVLPAICASFGGNNYYDHGPTYKENDILFWMDAHLFETH